MSAFPGQIKRNPNIGNRRKAIARLLYKELGEQWPEIVTRMAHEAAVYGDVVPRTDLARPRLVHDADKAERDRKRKAERNRLKTERERLVRQGKLKVNRSRR